MALNTSKQEIHTEGITLENHNYSDYDKITTAFTKELGIIKIFIKGANRYKNKNNTISTPLTRAEFIIKRTKGELWHYCDGSLLQSYSKLRYDIDTLEAALGMLRAIKVSQMIEKPSPHLYKLLALFLSKLESAQSPAKLLASLQLKILIHEGMIDLQQHCTICKKECLPITICNGECYCDKDLPEPGIECDNEEILSILCLQNSRSLKQIDTLPVSENITLKIEQLFDSTLQSNH